MILLWSGGGLLCFLFSTVLAVSFGSVNIPLNDIWKVIIHSFYPDVAVDSASQAIIWELRFPRVLLSALIGASLAVAGAVYQGLFQNQLADPYILGISSGSAAGAVLGILIGLGTTGTSLSAFIGASVSLYMVLYLASERHHFTVNRLILAGVIVQSLFGAMVSFCLSISYAQVQTIVYWLLGSFTLATWKQVMITVSFFLPAFLIAIMLSRQLNILSLGDRRATYLGLSVTRLRLILLLVASLLTAVSVSVSGTIGFIGLVVPHMTRHFVGHDHRFLLPSTAIVGAIFTIWVDWISRVVIAPQELPIGVVTAMVGAPFFAFIFKQSRNRRYYA